MKDSLGHPFIEIRGVIEEGDLDKIQKVSADLLTSQSDPMTVRRPLTFQVNTPGGDVLEAIKIGIFFRELLAGAQSYGRLIYAKGSKEEVFLASRTSDPDNVFLPIDATIQDTDIVRNYSAGILIFFGAVKRAHRDNSDQRLYPSRTSIPVMGIHRPYFSKTYYASLTPLEAEAAYQKLETAVRAYLGRMGAPQLLVDRMFTRASTEIELIPQEEFRKLYKPEESFLQEWFIARCGIGTPSAVLSEPELRDFRNIEQFQTASRFKDKDSLDKSPYYIYPNPEYETAYAETLYGKVRRYNLGVERCRASAIETHQLQWAKAYLTPNKAFDSMKPKN